MDRNVEMERGVMGVGGGWLSRDAPYLHYIGVAWLVARGGVGSVPDSLHQRKPPALKKPEMSPDCPVACFLRNTMP